MALLQSAKLVAIQDGTPRIGQRILGGVGLITLSTLMFFAAHIGENGLLPASLLLYETDLCRPIVPVKFSNLL
ncbi:MAG TPA: hypothetical protein VGK22_09590 [Candidatus Angelobacter sp.]